MHYSGCMKKTTFVALLLLCGPCWADSFARPIADSVNAIERSWAAIYYDTAKPKQLAAYGELLAKVTALSEQHPSQPALIYWQAVTLATQAEHLDPLAALDAIQNARDLLEKAIAIDPNVLNGSALVTLGTLYYKTPKWPIAFGDNSKAEALLETALKINPNGIDSNYFYGDFLLSNDRPKEAEKYFTRALTAVPSSAITYTDSRLQEEARAALKKAREEAG